MENIHQNPEWFSNVPVVSNNVESIFPSVLPEWQWQIPVVIQGNIEEYRHGNGMILEESGSGGLGCNSSTSTTTWISCSGGQDGDSRSGGGGGGSVPNTKSHSQAEKRRRDRINGHLSTLRNILPNSHHKMDKAALLSSVIQYVKDLKSKSMEVCTKFNGTLPTELDEVTVDHLPRPTDNNNNINNNILIKTSICCDDQPDIFSEIIRVLKRLRLMVVKADIATVGKRIKSILVVCNNKEDSNENSVDLSNLKQSLDLVLNQMSCSSSSSFSSNYRVRSKRHKLFFPSYF